MKNLFRLDAWMVLGCAVLAAAGNLGAASAGNAFVTVTAVNKTNYNDSARGIGSVVPVKLDFHITTCHVEENFVAAVTVTANYPYKLTSSEKFDMGLGETEKWSVVNESNPTEETATGEIILFKIDVEIDGVEEAMEETEGAYAVYSNCELFCKEDKNQHDPKCVKYFKEVKFKFWPDDRPKDKIEITTPEGFLFEVKNNQYIPVPEKSTYTMKQMQEKKFVLHGHEYSKAARDREIKAGFQINGTTDIAKFTVFDFEVRIDTLNTNGVELPPPYDLETARIKDEGGSLEKPGKFIYMNDMDVDGDEIPDFLDGFGAVKSSDPMITERQQIITTGAFVPLVLKRQYPGIPLQLTFAYADIDPSSICDKISFAQAKKIAEQCAKENPYGSTIRIWTKNANENRDPKSVKEGGDFIKSGESIISTNLTWISETEAILYVEGIGTSSEWGGQKISVTAVPVSLEEETPRSLNVEKEDKVSYTVVRCVFKMCVYRPYVCNRGNYGRVTSRVQFLTNYDTPRTMIDDYFRGLKGLDDYGVLKETGAFMGHAFARVEIRTPEMNEFYWTGHTGSDGITETKKAYHSMKDGQIFWFRAADGHEDNPATTQKRYSDLYNPP